MQIKFFKQISESAAGEAQISSVCFSPNGQKLAICVDRVVQLYDETGELRDRFATKPIDSKYGRQSYVVTGMDFSPDSTQLAVAQSDNIVFVYKLGTDWGEKKSIVAKFVQSAHVTSLIWLPDGQVIFGLADGKVRSGNVKKNKSTTLYTAEHYTVSLAPNVTRKAILSGHADGSICRYIIEDEGNGEKPGLVVRHSCPPCALVWSSKGILVGGCDRRIVVYNKDGKSLQSFDYSREPLEREFSVGICNPTGNLKKNLFISLQCFIDRSFTDFVLLFLFTKKKSIAKVKNVLSVRTIVFGFSRINREKECSKKQLSKKFVTCTQ